MNEINLITPPDILYNRNYNILLLYPSLETENQLQKILETLTNKYNVYFYNSIETHDYDWLFTVHRLVNICIINLDNLPKEIKSIESYLISFDHVYWITQGDNVLYSKISNNRIYDLDILKNKIGGFVAL